MSPARTRRKAGAVPEPPPVRAGDGYEGLDWDLYRMARAGRVHTAVGPGLVEYGLWMHVVRQRMPEPAEPGVPTGVITQ